MTVATAVEASVAARELALKVMREVNNGKLDRALTLAREGWRDFPDATIKGATFERLVLSIAQRAGYDSEQAPAAAVVVESVPVSAVPVSVAPVSAVPVSVPIVGTLQHAMRLEPVAEIQRAKITIERHETQGTIIRGWNSDAEPILRGQLGWRWARTGGWFYLGDRETAPDMSEIYAAESALAGSGLFDVVVDVRGDEAAAPARERSGGKRRNAPVSSAPVSVAPVSASPVSSAPVSVAPVSAAPVSAAPAPSGLSPELAAVMAQLAQMQAQLTALASAPKVSAPAPVLPVVPQVQVAPVVESAEDDELALMMASLISAQEEKIRATVWKFNLRQNARPRQTSEELRGALANLVGGYYRDNGLGTVEFGVLRDSDAPGSLLVSVKSVSGDISPSMLAKQVTGVALTVRGIGGVGRSAR